jgi:hypothetical protein
VSSLLSSAIFAVIVKGTDNSILSRDPDHGP